MVVRTELFKLHNLKFNENIGPNNTDCYPMGSETEFTKRAFSMGFKCLSSDKFVVHHWIPESHLSKEWILKRAFRLGRGVTMNDFNKNTRFNYLKYNLRVALYRIFLKLSPFIGKKRMFRWEFNKMFYKGCCYAIKGNRLL